MVSHTRQIILLFGILMSCFAYMTVATDIVLRPNTVLHRPYGPSAVRKTTERTCLHGRPAELQDGHVVAQCIVPIHLQHELAVQILVRPCRYIRNGCKKYCTSWIGFFTRSIFRHFKKARSILQKGGIDSHIHTHVSRIQVHMHLLSHHRQ